MKPGGQQISTRRSGGMHRHMSDSHVSHRVIQAAADPLRENLAQVHARYIAGLPEVNHSMSPRAFWRSLLTRRPGTWARAIVMIFGTVQAPGMRPAFSCASRGYYGLYLPPGERRSLMFAPCLLGCRGTAR